MSPIMAAYYLVPDKHETTHHNDGGWTHSQGPEFEILMALSISEFGLDSNNEELIRNLGIHNLGYLIGHSHSQIEATIDTVSMEIIDSGLYEMGLSFDMSVSPNKLSDFELVVTPNGLTKQWRRR